MSKIKLIIVFLITAPIYSNGQVNKVLNYSFEKYGSCSGLGNCTGSAVGDWYSPVLSYINWFSFPCFGYSATEGVPQNIAGYQYARTGVCYGGVEISEAPTRTYITGTFSNTLIATKKYCITYYVSLGDSVWWAVSAMGAYLSKDSIVCESNWNVLLDTPQINNLSTNILTDKINWVPISGEYQASGGEKFITIGDFYSDTLSHFTYVGNGGTTAGWQTAVQTYYFVDDVYVRELTIAVAGKADTVCLGDSVLIGKDTVTTGVSFHWLPTAGLSNPNIAQPKASPITTTTYTLTVVNDSIHNCNCADSVTKDSVVISVCSGINDLKNRNGGISIYPNPSKGSFILSMNSISDKPEIEIYNVLGEVIYKSQIVSNKTEIILTQPKGIYFFRVLNKNRGLLGNGKLVIE